MHNAQRHALVPSDLRFYPLTPPRILHCALICALLLAQSADAGQLTQADCDCAQIVGSCMVGTPIIEQSHDIGEMFNVRNWSLSLKVEPGVQCAQVSIALSYQENGQLRVGMGNANYQSLLPNGGPGPVVIQGTKRDTLEEMSLTVGVDPGGIRCQLCAVRNKEKKDASLDKEADQLAKELGLDTGLSGNTSLTEQASQLESDLARWEDQERERQRREAEERARLAAEEERRRMQEDMERARLAAEQAQMQAQSPPPAEESGFGWGDLLGAVGAGVVTGLANNYIAEHGGTPIAGGIPPGLTSQPQVASGSGLSPECDAVMPNLQSIMSQCNNTGHLQGICHKARYGADCFRRAEAASGRCAEAAAQARQYRQQFEQQALEFCQ